MNPTLYPPLSSWTIQPSPRPRVQAGNRKGGPTRTVAASLFPHRCLGRRRASRNVRPGYHPHPPAPRSGVGGSMVTRPVKRKG